MHCIVVIIRGLVMLEQKLTLAEVNISLCFLSRYVLFAYA